MLFYTLPDPCLSFAFHFRFPHLLLITSIIPYLSTSYNIIYFTLLVTHSILQLLPALPTPIFDFLTYL